MCRAPNRDLCCRTRETLLGWDIGRTIRRSVWSAPGAKRPKSDGGANPSPARDGNALNCQERRDRRIGFVEALRRQAGEARANRTARFPPRKWFSLIRGLPMPLHGPVTLPEGQSDEPDRNRTSPFLVIAGNDPWNANRETSGRPKSIDPNEVRVRGKVHDWYGKLYPFVQRIQHHA